jgi:hypothetical protein
MIDHVYLPGTYAHRKGRRGFGTKGGGCDARIFRHQQVIGVKIKAAVLGIWVFEIMTVNLECSTDYYILSPTFSLWISRPFSLFSSTLNGIFGYGIGLVLDLFYPASTQRLSLYLY